MPDAHATSEPDRVRKRNAAGPFDPFEQKSIKQAERRAQQLGVDAHAPVAEAMDGDCPESLLEEITSVRMEVLAPKREKAHSRRVDVHRPLRRGGRGCCSQR